MNRSDLLETSKLSTFKDEVGELLISLYADQPKNKKYMNLIASIINSAITEKKPTFTISRSVLEDIAKTDINLKSIDNVTRRNYDRAMKEIQNFGIAAKLRKGVGKVSAIYHIVESDIIDYMGINDKNLYYYNERQDEILRAYEKKINGVRNVKRQLKKQSVQTTESISREEKDIWGNRRDSTDVWYWTSIS